MYEINPEVAGRLMDARNHKRFDEQGNENPLPSDLRDAFSRWEKYFHLLSGTHISDEALATICCLADLKLQAEPPVPVAWNSANEWRNKRLKYDDAVTVVWKDEKTAGRIRGIADGDRVVIVLDNDKNGHERKVHWCTVLPAEPKPELVEAT